uniref:L,D-transpeptidase family protein n=1 Tax=Altererythrobacter segetis TaxID=1104773 RepID=UPI00140ADAFA|nr:L,D-transpeptidase family protein [Altererythrobacter segetis]
MSQPAFAKKKAAPPPVAVHVPTFQEQLASHATGELKSFYAYRSAPMWTRADGTFDPAALELVKLVQTADADGLDPAALHASELAQAVSQAQATPTPAALIDAEVRLSQSFADYVAALRKPAPSGMTYEAATLRPHTLGTYYTLSEAAKAPSLAEYIHDMRWMHPLYAPLRRLVAEGAAGPSERQVAVANLARIRDIPAHPADRYILIDAANATLSMYEGDRVVDTMRVIVGKAVTQTPIYAGYVRYAVTNPYWNVPDNLVRSLIARNMLSQGARYMKRQGYEVVDGWEPDAAALDPNSIDWHAVQRGDIEPHVRQLPGPINSMGKVKYEFPNVYGIYLHDTPEKDLLEKDVRQLSNGCIRLEDANRLGRWLLGGDLAAISKGAPEQKVDLPQPVPLYITYLTAHPDGDRIAVSSDPYAHDRQTLAALD